MGEIGGSFIGTVKPIVSLPMVVRYGRLGGRWFDSAGRFVFCFVLANLIFLGARRPLWLGIWVDSKKRSMGPHS